MKPRRPTNARHVTPFAVYRAVMAGRTDPDDIARLTGVRPARAAKLIEAKGWRPPDEAPAPDLVEAFEAA